MFTSYIKSGWVFIELIIAMSIGLLLIGLLLTAYVASEKSDRLQTTLNHIQDNAINAIHLLNTALHQSGYVGCAHLTSDFPIIPYQGYSFNSYNKLIGNENEFTVRFMDDTSVLLKKDMQNNSILYTSKEVVFSPGNILIISNCKQAELFQVASVSTTSFYQKIVTQQPLHYLFQGYSEIGRLIINKYFIARTKRVHLDGSPIYALYVADIFHHQTELVEEINHMKITYSLKENGRLIDVSAEGVCDWSHVMGVNIDLMVNSFPFTKHWYTYVAIHS